MAASRFTQLVSNLDESVVAFAARLNTILTGLGNITITGFDVTVKRNDVFRATITYTTGGTVYGAVGFADTAHPNDPDGTATQLDNFFQANPTYTGVYIRSVQPQDISQIPIGHLIALYDTTPGSGTAHPFERTLKFVRATAGAIAAGAAGTVDILNGSGAAITTQIMRNRSPNAFNVGTEGYAYFDEIAGEYVGYPICCP